MDMSSYQFVNTLAQCYEQAGVVGGLPGAAAGAGAVVTPHEYYGMQYPACYSPATQAAAYSSHQYASMMTSAQQQQQQQQPDYSSPPSSTTALSHHRRSPVATTGGLGGLSAAPPLGSGPLSNLLSGSSLNTSGGNNTGAGLLPQQANCKYADSNVGSPQDLSTNSSGGTPQPPVGGVPHSGGGGIGPKSPESELEDDDEDEEPSSPLSPSPGASGSGGAATKKEAGSGGGDSKSNPPQIYPWMKRVHLGQSKSIFSLPFFVVVL